MVIRWSARLAFFANSIDYAREIQFLGGADFCGNDAEYHAYVAALLENVDAETAEACYAVGHVELGGFLEFLLLAVGHHAERHGEHFFRGDAGDVGEWGEQAVYAEVRVVADFQM
jgi:hypothetical protein